MNLLVAMQQLATFINVWRTDTEGRSSIRDAGPVLHVDAVAGRDAIPELQQKLVWTIPGKLLEFGTRQHPDADAIPVDERRCSPGMAATLFAHILDIHAEQDRARPSVSIGIGPVTD